MELALCYICWMAKWRNRSKYRADVQQDSVGRGDTQNDPSFIQSDPSLSQDGPSAQVTSDLKGACLEIIGYDQEQELGKTVSASANASI